MTVGRNDPCHCGSGKKYKKCCLDRDEAQAVKPEPVTPTVRDQKKKPQTPYCPSPIPSKVIHEKMESGYKLIARQKCVEGCNVWLELWDSIKVVIPPEVMTVDHTDDWNPDGQYFSNWCQDLEMELGNAACDDPSFHQKRLQFCQEFCDVFPESDENSLHGMKRAIGESYYHMGEIEKGEACFKKLIEEYPRNVWSYIGWGDMYLWPYKKLYPQDLARAEEIYKMFKETDPEGALDERLEHINIEKSKLLRGGRMA